MSRTRNTRKARPSTPPRTVLKTQPVADLQPKTTPASRQITDGPGVRVVGGKGI